MKSNMQMGIVKNRKPAGADGPNSLLLDATGLVDVHIVAPFSTLVIEIFDKASWWRWKMS